MLGVLCMHVWEFPHGGCIVCACCELEFLHAGYIVRRHTVSQQARLAFPACHQCYCAGSSLAWGVNFRAYVWDFLKLIARGFLRVLRFPLLLHHFHGSANKIKLK